MTARKWQPGDVALVRNEYNVWNVAICAVRRGRRGFVWSYGVADSESPIEADARPLVVIDPEDREQVRRLVGLYLDAEGSAADVMQAALREFADPKPAEPTDPRARVTDRRENVWRLLADGDWVCTSGPDVGEYLVWWQLAADRGPLSIEAAS